MYVYLQSYGCHKNGNKQMHLVSKGDVSDDDEYVFYAVVGAQLLDLGYQNLLFQLKPHEQQLASNVVINFYETL
jgi:hypothetical protein